MAIKKIIKIQHGTVCTCGKAIYSQTSIDEFERRVEGHLFDCTDNNSEEHNEWCGRFYDEWRAIKKKGVNNG